MPNPNKIPIDTTGFYNRSVDLMNKYKNLNFVQRAINPNLQKMTISDPNPSNKGGFMSHRMSYAGDNKEGFVAYPEVVQIKNKLKYIPGRQAMEYAYKTKQAIPVGTDKNFADYFTTVGYKYKMNPDVYSQAMKDYVKDTNIMKLIPKNKKGGSSKNWIQKAVNPAHKGYCTPMTKSTCTPRRKALARTFKKMAKARKHQDGGLIDFLMPLIEQYKKGGKLSKEYIKKAHEKPGGSNVGKKTFASGAKRTGPYVGPSGGAPKGSYPIPDKKHAKSALSLAHHAPNPAGIKAAVYRKYPELKKSSNKNE